MGFAERPREHTSGLRLDEGGNVNVVIEFDVFLDILPVKFSDMLFFRFLSHVFACFRS